MPHEWNTTTKTGFSSDISRESEGEHRGEVEAPVIALARTPRQMMEVVEYLVQRIGEERLKK